MKPRAETPSALERLLPARSPRTCCRAWLLVRNAVTSHHRVDERSQSWLGGVIRVVDTDVALATGSARNRVLRLLHQVEIDRVGREVRPRGGEHHVAVVIRT